MKGSEFLASLPPEAGAAREKAILNAVVGGQSIPFDWEPVVSEYNGHKATLYVTSDCLRIGDETDSVRVSVTAITAQAIAEHFGAFLPTTHIADLVWKQSKVHIEPCLFGEPRSATSRMRDYHQSVEKKVAARSGLIENVGKHWVVTNKLLTSPGKAANYGFFSASAPNVSASGIRMWQTLGLAHNGSHVDYSQVVRLIGEKLIVDGQSMLFKDVATNPALAGLVSSEGVLRTLRGCPQAAASLPVVPSPARVTVAALKLIQLPLRVGSHGQGVRTWQAFVGVNDDGDFGPVTAGATELFRIRAGLPKGRIVDQATLDAAITQLHSNEPFPFVQAKNYTKASRGLLDLHWVVLHTIEAAEKGTTAEACAEYFRTTTRQASAHYCIDVDSVVQCVRLADVAWAAPGANRHGVHLEHAGFAKQSPAEWLDDYSASMLRRSAKLTAKLMSDSKMQVAFIDRDKLRAARKLLDAGKPCPLELRGITTHNEVSQAFKQSTHYDPGPNFPMPVYLDLVKGNC